MPIYEFACPQCRKIFNFLAKTSRPEKSPACPKCGHSPLVKQLSSFAMPRSDSKPQAGPDPASRPAPDDSRLMQAMAEMERDMSHLDETNPKHMAHLMKKMRGLVPGKDKDLDLAIKRLEAGEDIEKIEADMGDLFGGAEDSSASGGDGGSFSRDSGLYDY